MRPSGRAPDQMRAIVMEPGFTRHAEGSCLVSFGDTRVLCTASVETNLPGWLRGQGRGWVTAEYGMLPRGTHTRGLVAAVSCGIHNGTAVLDLDYAEDSTAGSDGNFVLTGDGKLVEAQISAEGEVFDEEGLLRLLRLARIGCGEIFAAQDKATGR